MGHPIQMKGTVLDRVAEDSKPYLGTTFGGCGSRNHLEDIDGVLGPSGKGPGFLVNDNNDDMLAFMGGSCTSTATSSGCPTAFCEGVCLRQVKLRPGQSGVASVEVTNGAGVRHIFSSGNSVEGFDIVLPKDTYRVRFFDALGNHIPQVMGTLLFYKAPLCQNHITEDDFAFQGVAFDNYEPYEVLQYETGGCPGGGDITTVQECELAAQTLSLNLRDSKVIEESKWFLPCGKLECSFRL